MKHMRMFILLLATVGFLTAYKTNPHYEEIVSAVAEVSKTWDEALLAEWATPVAGLNMRPTHISAKEYYAMPVENLRTYPVYFPGREPEGYWDMLQRIGPQPLIEPEKLKTEADWIDAGRRVFEQAATPQLSTFDPKVIEQVRSREFMEQQGATPFPDGALDLLRWAPTKQGVALSVVLCGACHVLNRSDGARVPGAPRLAEVSRTTRPPRFRAGAYIESANRVVTGAPPFFMGGTRGIGVWLYQAYGVPWLMDDPNQRLKDFTAADYEEFVLAQRRAGAIARWNGSLLYPAKIPDLIGIKDRKYLDNTGTHLHR